MDHPIQFTEGVRVLMLIDRAIGNTNKGSKRWLNKLVSTNSQEFYQNLEKLKNQLVYLNEPSVRIYSSINPRNLDKAIRTFQHRQLDLHTSFEKNSFYHDIRASFVSCLMQPENREMLDNKFYLVDIDSKEDSQKYLNELKEKDICIYDYETPNGWHILCKPFDVRLCKEWPNTEVKTDALMIWSVLPEVRE